MRRGARHLNRRRRAEPRERALSAERGARLADCSTVRDEQVREIDPVGFGDEAQQAELAMRLQGFLQELGLRALTENQEQIRVYAKRRIAALARDAFSDTEHLQHQLRWLANQLEDREVRAKIAVTEDFGLGDNAIGGTPTYGGIEHEGDTA